MASYSRSIITFLLVLLFMVVVAVTVLAVLYAERIKDKQETDGNKTETKASVVQPEPDVDLTTCDDIAIIGAGAAGTYTAWRLRNQDKKITVYEYSDRIGGRCYTVKFPGIPDVNIEMGAMRFKPNEHPLINRTVHELGLSLKDFDVGYGYHPDSLIYIRGQHLRYKDIGNVTVPYNLGDHMHTSFSQLLWEVYSNNTDVNPDLDGYMDLDNRRYLKTTDGVELWKQSRRGFNYKYVNADTAKYLQDVGHWDSAYGEASAAKFGPTSKPNPVPGPSQPVKTVVSGFQSIPETLMQEFLDTDDKHSYVKNHHLKSIKKHQDNYILKFQPTETVDGVTKEVELGHYLDPEPQYKCAKKVILAVGRLALDKIEWDGFKDEEVQDYMQNSILEAHAAKQYFVYDSDWWRALDKTSWLTISDTPLRQTFHYAHSGNSNSYVLNAGYTDSNTYVSFWRELKRQGTKYPGTSDNTISASSSTVNTARKFLAEVYNVSIEGIPEPRYAMMSLWDSYPYGAGWYHYKAGYDWNNVQTKMIRPSAVDDVYIVSNAFSAPGRSAWVEGAFEIVELALKYFQL